MIRGAILVGGFFGGLACFVAGAYVAFGTGAALVVAGLVLLFLSFVVSLGDDEGEGTVAPDAEDEWEYDADDVGDGTDTP